MRLVASAWVPSICPPQIFPGDSIPEFFLIPRCPTFYSVFSFRFFNLVINRWCLCTKTRYSLNTDGGQAHVILPSRTYEELVDLDSARGSCVFSCVPCWQAHGAPWKSSSKSTDAKAAVVKPSHKIKQRIWMWKGGGVRSASGVGWERVRITMMCACAKPSTDQSVILVYSSWVRHRVPGTDSVPTGDLTGEAESRAVLKARQIPFGLEYLNNTLHSGITGSLQWVGTASSVPSFSPKSFHSS